MFTALPLAQPRREHAATLAENGTYNNKISTTIVISRPASRTPISSSFGSSAPNERTNFRQVGILLNDTDVLDANIDLRAQPNGKE
jgi:hypothetical protein